MASATTSWMPAQGKFQVTIGSSLNRALKARKQGRTPPATNPKRNLPDRDFYSFRYNFKPPSIDSTKPGTIEVKKGKDKTQVAVEHLSSQAGEAYVFAGTETQAKEWDCVLVYDDETGAYTLEKLDSFVNLTWERKRTPTARAPSPVAPSPADRDAEGDDDEELENELLDLAEEIPLAKIVKQKQKPSQPPPRPPPQKEEEEEEEIFIPPVTAPQPPKAQPTKASRPAKPLPKPRASLPASAMEPPPPPVTTAVPAAATPKPKPAQKKKRKEPEAPVLSDPEVEVLSFGQPAKRAKVPAESPAPAPVAAPSEGFALPGSSNSGFFQAPPPAIAKTQRTPAALPLQPTLAAEDSDGDSEDWEEVTNAEPAPEPVPRALSYHSDEGDVGDGLFGDEDAEMEDELTKQLNEELDGDFLEAAMTEPLPDNVQPLSWDQLAEAGGIAPVYDSDDDFSSSDDSDDE